MVRSARANDAIRVCPYAAMVLSAALAACDPGFIDPTPPELESLTRSAEIVTHPHPVVFQIVLDLEVPDSGECARVRDRILRDTRSILRGVDSHPLELPWVDISPGCVQPSNRGYDHAALATQLQKLRAEHPDQMLRPVILYFNNVNLPLPPRLVADLVKAREAGALPGEHAAFLWATARDVPLRSISFDQTMPWTFTSDPSLLSGIEKMASLHLPLMTSSARPERGPLFSDEELDWILEFKGCKVPGQIRGDGFSLNGEPVPLRPEAPPHFEVVDARTEIPLPKSRVPPVLLEFRIEVCRANCARFYPSGDDYVIWNSTTTCLTPEAAR